MEQQKTPMGTIKYIQTYWMLILLILLTIVVCILTTINKIDIPRNNIYICDNPNYPSDFDKWIKEDVGIDWLPSYIIIKDGKVIGKFNGDISKKEFKAELDNVLANSTMNVELPNDYKITDIDNNTNSIYNIFNYNTTNMKILEVHWIDCPDCQHQDDKYTNDIYKYINKYYNGISNVYRYYIKSERAKVEENYN